MRSRDGSKSCLIVKCLGGACRFGDFRNVGSGLYTRGTSSFSYTVIDCTALSSGLRLTNRRRECVEFQLSNQPIICSHIQLAISIAIRAIELPFYELQEPKSVSWYDLCLTKTQTFDWSENLLHTFRPCCLWAGLDLVVPVSQRWLVRPVHPSRHNHFICRLCLNWYKCC